MMRAFSRVLFMLVFFSFGSPPSGMAGEFASDAAEPQVSNAGCSAVIGSWLWMNGAKVECFADSSCTASNGFEGRWRCLGDGRIEIRWARPGQAPQYTDTVSVSSDGSRLTGRNQLGGGISATKVATEPKPGTDCTGIHGAWRWHNGASVTFKQDGTCSSSTGFSGTWRCLDRSGRFEIQWSRPGQPPQFVDTVDLSADGQRLSGRNQYGVGVGAERVVVEASGGGGGEGGEEPGAIGGLTEEDLGEESVQLDDYDGFDEHAVPFDCTPRTITGSLGAETGLEVRVEVFGLENGRCHFRQTIVADEHGLGLAGTEMTCRLPRDQGSQGISAFCEGSLVTTYLRLTGGH